MEGAELILTTPVTSPDVLLHTQPAAGKQTDADKLKKLAKDFESVLLSQLVSTMKETLSSISEDEQETGSGQVKDMFWMCFSREIGDKGGLGLWKDLYRFFSDMQKKQNLTVDGRSDHSEPLAESRLSETQTTEKNLKLNSADSTVSVVRSVDNFTQTLDENL
jgi:Rod binding domain-containing protein